MPGTESDSQSPIFLERLQGIFSRDKKSTSDEGPNTRGVVIATCLLLSFFLWFVFTMQETYTSEFELPTVVTNIPNDEALSSLPPPRARVRVQGEGFQLMRLALSPPSIPIDASTGEIDLQNAVDLPPGVTLQAVTPQQIEVTTEPRIYRSVPVQFRGTVQTPPTHGLLGDPSVEPDSLTVSGAESIVNELQAWPTDSLFLENVRDSVSATVALKDTLRGLVTPSVREARVLALAGRFTEGRREIEVRVAGGPQQAVTFEPSVLEVRYRVLVDEYREAQDAQDFFAEVSFEEIRADTTGYIRPTLNLPGDLEIRNVEMIPPRLRYYMFMPGE